MSAQLQPVLGPSAALPAGSSSRPASPPSTMSRWWRFNFVGGIGIIVQFAALFVLKSVFGFHYLFATIIAVEAAVVHNFVWHEQFTWVDRVRADRVKTDRVRSDRVGRLRSRWSASLSRFARFNLANGAVSVLGNVSLMRVLVGWGHLNYLLANAVAIALCSVANFLVSDAWVFEDAGVRGTGLENIREGHDLQSCR